MNIDMGVSFTRQWKISLKMFRTYKLVDNKFIQISVIQNLDLGADQFFKTQIKAKAAALVLYSLIAH